MKYLHIYFLSIALLFTFDLNASKYEKESASDLYKKATKQLKEEDFKEEVNVELNQDDLKKLEAIEDDLNSKGIISSYLETRVNGYEVFGSGYKHWYNNEPYYLYYCPYTECPIAYEWLDTFNHKHFYLAC